MKVRVPQLDQRTNRVIRGGSWYDIPGIARVAYRTGIPPATRLSFLTFRPVFGG